MQLEAMLILVLLLVPMLSINFRLKNQIVKAIFQPVWVGCGSCVVAGVNYAVIVVIVVLDEPIELLLVLQLVQCYVSNAIGTDIGVSLGIVGVISVDIVFVIHLYQCRFEYWYTV